MKIARIRFPRRPSTRATEGMKTLSPAHEAGGATRRVQEAPLERRNVSACVPDQCFGLADTVDRTALLLVVRSPLNSSIPTGDDDRPVPRVALAISGAFTRPATHPLSCALRAVSEVGCPE